MTTTTEDEEEENLKDITQSTKSQSLRCKPNMRKSLGKQDPWLVVGVLDNKIRKYHCKQQYDRGHD